MFVGEIIDLLSLVDDNRVLKQVAHVYSFASANNFGVFLAEKPADVREKESSVGVVGVGIGFAELVMHPMITTPFVDVVLYLHVNVC